MPDARADSAAAVAAAANSKQPLRDPSREHDAGRSLLAPGPAAQDSGGLLSSSPTFSDSHSPFSTTSVIASQPPVTVAASSTGPQSKSEPGPLQPNHITQRDRPSSSSLAPSAVEAQPVPACNTTGQKQNKKDSSRDSCHSSQAATSGSQPKTYSQPVLVKTYNGPPTSRGSRGARSHYRSNSRDFSRSVTLLSSSAPGIDALAGQPAQPTVTGVGVDVSSTYNRVSLDDGAGANARTINDMSVFYRPRKSSSSSGGKLAKWWPWRAREEPDEPRLPPLEAFSFKNLLADAQTRGSEYDITADLDRIAEICARSRYSLSNQYEVHVAPHGSGASFVSGTAPSTTSAPVRRKTGPSHSRSSSAGSIAMNTIPSEDEGSVSSAQSRRRALGRRRSMAMCTLETIMSTSRSSDEDKSKKMSASELISEVRGRAARKAGDSGAVEGSSTQAPDTAPPSSNKLARKKSASFATAIINNSSGSNESVTAAASSSTLPSAGAASLHSDPARPQTSHSSLGIGTTTFPAQHSDQGPATTGHHSSGHASGGLGSWTSWLPSWSGTMHTTALRQRATGIGAQPTDAEASLRQLLAR
ncbi:uncharacterized protein CTHT_0028460 [Thermochaetoides thermophila DSM 1495]|uniref:Uncharacterized protein n=1 Tax=Chaetomium thermophilum (strain DSM 1495 / CBS 144.50 / IMI 039719) TaxID=759272 RepID=G0S7Q6_CHATD|nr:hypothetical protein CTHT_0028460 [Thermochaetoides thermophila DSM 1495]EGS21006.1 hypothetical protein CTHT_0028460 [Thermochaetoides thermophila DSM 1495]